MLTPGQQFAHFRIDRKIGEGGMGAVFLAEDQKLGRQVALKILLAEYFDDAERRERFYREARTAAQVSHPNVMGIYDLGVEKEPGSNRDMNYIVMEYIAGRSLASILREDKPDMATILRYASKIASGLAAAHQKGIVHRDIKAENILVDESGEPKVLDFGLAKPVTPVQFEKEGEDSTRTVSQELTRAGKILGTVTYMSPEQVRGEKVDNRSDIFSFGILLYQMATGEMPFAGKTQVSTLAKILESQPEPPHLKNADIPAELERIIAKCLQKDPADRYQDTRDLVVDLRSLRRQYDSGVTETVSAITDRMPAGGRTFKINLTWKLVIVILVGMVIVSGLIEQCLDVDVETRMSDLPGGGEIDKALSLAGRLAQGVNSLAILSFSNKTGDPELDWLQTGLPEIMLTDLSQSGSINIISRERVFDHLGVRSDEQYSREDYVDAAKALGAAKLLSGSFFKVGDQIRIDARLEDITSGTILLGEKVVGSDPFVLVDSLTTKIATSLNVAQADARDISASSFASSPEAYKEYHKGVELFGLSQWEEAIKQFEKAIEIDSTFALPYMRIGMVHVFQGRQQKGVGYLSKALVYQDKLPRRERSLLDIYVDLWQRQQYEPAYDKIKRFVETYPEDKEGRTFYAVAISAFERDTVQAFIQLDTVLMIDPEYPFALQQYADLRSQYNNFEGAIPSYERLLETSPQTADYYQSLGTLYFRLNRFDDAIELYREAMERFPDDPDPISSLANAYVQKRELDKAEQLLARIPKEFGDDPYEMRQYDNSMGNLSLWRGRFKENLAWRHRALEHAQKTGDENLISSSYGVLKGFFDLMGQRDSAHYYLRQAYKVAGTFQRMSYPIEVVAMDHSQAEEMRALFTREITDFRNRLPQQMHSLADGLDSLFEAHAAADTAAVIRAYYLIKSSQPNQTGNDYAIGQIMVKTGRYKEAIDVLTPLVEGTERTNSGFTYPMTHYYLGVASQELGDRTTAVEHFREMLRFWSNPDTELKEIADARARLAQLTS
ncbi:MAG: protein kinase [candidate division Zixibacteria bacterium]|nr:protein kinase [candidate division Zixibacteria bacterium]